MENTDNTSLHELEILDSNFNIPNNNKETSESFKLIKLTLIDDEYNFKLLSPFKIHKSLNLISTTWDWVNYTNNYKTLTIKEKLQSKVKDFLNLNKLEINGIPYNIKALECLPANHSKGVIYSKCLLTISDEDILKSLKSEKVCDIYRFKKTLSNGKSFETGSFALTFLNCKRPEQVMISFLKLQVYPLLQKPMQCNHCMLIGHTKKRCKSSHEAYCKSCYHRTLSEESHQCIIICKNCRGPHLSDSKACAAYLKESKIVQLKSNEQISYSDAKRIFNQKSHSPFEECNHSNTINEVETLKSERTHLKLINEQLKLVSKEQKSTITLLTEENENLKLQHTLIIKKLEINQKVTAEVLSQLKETSKLNSDLNLANQQLQDQNAKINCTTEEILKKLETSQFFGSCMKKFIDQHGKTAKEFQKYMDLIVNDNGSSDEY